MLSGVMTLKFLSYCQGNRDLEKEVREGGKGQGLVVAAALKAGVPLSGMAGGREWGLESKPWPENLSLTDTALFLFSPSLSYCPNIPRFTSLSITYLLEKAFLFIFWMFFLITLHERFLTPVWARTPTATTLTLKLLLFFDAVVPITLLSLGLYFCVFEYVCNFFAEATFQADRQFAGEWYASTSYEEFSRLWNFPVGDSLHTNIYKRLSNRSGKACGLLLTFLFSIAAHELFMWGCMGSQYRVPWLALFSVLQIPLIPLLRVLPGLKGMRAGNLFFWFGLSTGMGVIGLCYAYDFHRT